MDARIEPVDEIDVTVLVDNQTDSLSSVPGFVRQEWPSLVRAGMRELSGDCQCCANHGLALVVTARRGGTSRSMLFDTGPVGYALEGNGARLGVDFGAIGAVMLSHGHWDHAGGMIAALKLIGAANGGARIPCHLHPGMFRQRAMTLADASILPIAPIATPEELALLGAEPLLTTGAVAALDAMFFVSGEIPRVTAYERGFPGHLRRADDGESWEPDPLILDERFLAVNLRAGALHRLARDRRAGGGLWRSRGDPARRRPELRAARAVRHRTCRRRR